jgi:fatty acid-binding protein DegV
MCQFRQYKEFFEKLKKENRVNSYTIGSLMMEILEDRDMLFDYLDTPTVSVDFIDLLVEKTNEMYQEGKTEDEIDQKIKK